MPETAGGEPGNLYRALNRLAEEHRNRLQEHGAERTETEVLLQEMGEAVLALDESGRIVRTNAEMRSVIGAAEPLEGRAVATVFRNPELVEFLSSESVPEGGRDGEFEVFDRIMRVTSRRLPARGVVAVFSDLTELKRLEKVRTDFVANVSHELKTPLTSIRGFAETLLDVGLPADNRADFAGRIVQHAERMGAIVDDLLTLARLEDPGHVVTQQAIALKPLVHGVVQGLSARAKDVGLSISVGVEPADLEVRGDPEGLRQILENLIDNALRHSGADHVDVGAEAISSGEVRIRVTDNGRGIPEAQTDRIFERFYRVDTSRSRATGGTGLGLSIVRHWVESMGGRVWAESGVGMGTRIHVGLPRAHETAAAE